MTKYSCWLQYNWGMNITGCKYFLGIILILNIRMCRCTEVVDDLMLKILNIIDNLSQCCMEVVHHVSCKYRY